MFFVPGVQAQEIQIETVAITSTINNTLERPQKATEQPLAVKQIEPHEAYIKRCVNHYAVLHKVSVDEMWSVMKCENTELDPSLQSRLYYDFTDAKRGIYKGEPEMSYGLSQISLPHHNVTLEQATDVDFSINFMAEAFSKGKQSWWTCWKNQQVE